MKKFFITILLFTITMHSQTVNYFENYTNFTNPERGFYKRVITRDAGEIPLTTYHILSVSELQGYKNNGTSLILRIFNLEEFVNTDLISTSYLTKMNTDFINMRAAGVKCIIRFSYADTDDLLICPIRDVPKNRMLGHISQLAATTSQFQDVISSVEAGFIGVWGEWAISTNFGDSSSVIGLSTTNLENRKEIGNKILELLAPRRMVAFRTPRYQRLMLGLSTGLTAPTIITTVATVAAYAPRIAAHNDCFLSSSTDSGTYGTGSGSINSDRSWLEIQTKSTFDGGESCTLNSYNFPFNTQYTNATYAFAELGRFHFNYLSSEYFGEVVNPFPVLPSVLSVGLWANTPTPSAIIGSTNYLEEIRKKLGYRFVLKNSTITPNIVTVNIQNVGFGNVFNPRKAYLILKNIAGNVVAKVELNGINLDDVRNWNAATTTTPALNVSFSKNLTGYACPGTYNLYLELPDFERPTDPKYSIRLANNDVGGVPSWDVNTGHNNLFRTITTTSLPTPIITGSVAACTAAIATKQTINSTTLLPGQTATWTIPNLTGTFVSSNTSNSVTINWITLPTTLTLTVTLPGGCTVTKTQTIESICGCSCVDNIGFSQPINVVPSSNVVEIQPSPTASTTCDNVLNYSWNWGDGSPIDNTTIGRHCYTIAGNYIVTITAFLYNGCSRVYTYNVVGAPCLAGGGGSRSTNLYNNNTIKITPNPSSGIFNISMSNFDGKATIQVLDINGRIVYQAIEEHLDTEKQIDLSNAQSGIYILKVIGDNLNYSQKLIKN